MRRAAWTAAAALAATVAVAVAAPLEYGLAPQRVEAETWVIEGSREHFSRANGGNIVNTGFIVTDGGVVVVDTGPSAAYGREMRAAIAAVSDRPVVRALNTHLHPDHFLGNQAFAEAGILADAGTVAAIEREGQDLAANLYRLSGDWMRDTEPVVPRRLEVESELIGGHELRYLRLAGHTGSDLAVFDASTGVLFAGDLVFHDRAPTTPHADIGAWLAALDALEKLPFAVLVPGHGPVARSAAPIAQTRDYLVWLRDTLEQAAAHGLDITEVMQLPIPDRFAGLALVREEFVRSTVHLYPSIEQARFAHIRPK